MLSTEPGAGHLFAFRNLNFHPIRKEIDSLEYYKQERYIDEFAHTLLVPDWLAKLWVSSVSSAAPISHHSLRSWANEQCGISIQVVAKALAKVAANVGFIKAAEGLRQPAGERLFVVYYSASGAELRLPNLHAFIEDSSFVGGIQGGMGSRSMRDFASLGDHWNNLHISWHETVLPKTRKRREFNSKVRLSGKGFWISLRVDDAAGKPDQESDRQLSLF